MAKTNIPLFIVAGMPRTGTTFLYRYFQKHPSIWVPFRKDNEYFGLNFHRGLNWFLRLYRGMKPEQIGCDISTVYCMDPSTIDRIKSFSPDVKVIICIRDPVDLAFSIYCQLNNFMWNVPPFEEFLKVYTVPKGDRNYKVELSSGQLSRGIESYRKAFDENLLLYNFELFKKDPLLILQYIERFLGIPNYFTKDNFENVIINARNRKNIKLISYLANRECMINFLGIVVPRKMILFFRNIFDKMGQYYKDKNTFNYPPDQIRLATELLAEDIEYFNEIFKQSQVILGNGDSFS